MNLTLNLRNTQKLAPTTLQFMQVIQMTGVELCGYVNELVLENPMLDFVSPSSCAGGTNQSYTADSISSVPAKRSALSALYEDMCDQLYYADATERAICDARILAQLVDSRGYISEEDFEDCARALGQKRALCALGLVQSLSPAGIGARSLAECLLLQLERRDERSKLAESIVRYHLESVANGFYPQIAKTLGVRLEEVYEACRLIRSLSPNPCGEYASGADNNYIYPDVVIDGDGLVTVSSESIPELGVNGYYRDLLCETHDPEIARYLRLKLSQANMLIVNLGRRCKTLIRCAEIIVEKQSLFFSTQGRGEMLPLTQNEVAEVLEVNVSTVSRILQNKYLQCPFGTFRFDFFFNSSLGSSKSGAAEISSFDAKARIKDIIAREDARHPMSDQAVADLLCGDGISISRRTVAKYRAEAGIPGTSARRALYYGK